MPVVQGASEAAAELSAYLKRLAEYYQAHFTWDSNRKKREEAIHDHSVQRQRYVRDIKEWNLMRSFGNVLAVRPINPGSPPPPFNDPEPRRPQAPAGLHHREFQNRGNQLPRAPKGQSYHEAQVGADRTGGRGQHRIVLLANNWTGNVTAKYCTPDHYGDNARNTRPSWTRFR